MKLINLVIIPKKEENKAILTLIKLNWNLLQRYQEVRYVPTPHVDCDHYVLQRRTHIYKMYKERISLSPEEPLLESSVHLCSIINMS